MDFEHISPLPLSAIPLVSTECFVHDVAHELVKGGRLVALFGAPFPMPRTPVSGSTDGILRLYAVVAHDGARRLWISSTEPVEAYPSITPLCHQAHYFEREIYETWGITPQGHPWLKPIRFHDRPDGGERPRPCVTDYFQVEGADIHEVAVGPVHAGIIEPGHFRFQCAGEQVLSLEISLGYQHRGVERLLTGGPHPRSMHVVETLAGDTSVGHAWAYCALLETLRNAPPTPRGQGLRAVALELERLANHTGDLGALAGDVGYLPTASFCGRLRGDFLNMTALLCGSRFGRGVVRPGGSGVDVDKARVNELCGRLQTTMRDVRGAVELLFSAASVLNRFEGVGAVDASAALEVGLVGPAARACGLVRDARSTFGHPHVPAPVHPARTGETGDVMARAKVRWLEIQDSFEFILNTVRTLPEGPARSAQGLLDGCAPNTLAVALVEGWRGELCHVMATGPDGRVMWHKITDPSFHNWFGLALALRDTEISDFPLCNKSFNLSYCGHDL